MQLGLGNAMLQHLHLRRLFTTIAIVRLDVCTLRLSEIT